MTRARSFVHLSFWTLAAACAKPAPAPAVDASAPAVTRATPDAASTAPTRPGVDTLGIVAEYPRFVAAWNVGAALVLVGCGTIRVFEDDLAHGKDLAVPTISRTYKRTCVSDVEGVAGGRLVVAQTKPGKPQHAIDITTGADAPLTPWFGGTDTHPVAGVDAIFSYASGGRIVAHDKSDTSRQLWDYGLGRDADWRQRPVLWTSKGDEIVVTAYQPVGGDVEMVAFRRGAGEPPWHGTIKGTITPDTPDHLPIEVDVAGDRTTTTDAAGKYMVDVTTRGIVEVQTALCGSVCSGGPIFVAPNRGVQMYEMNLTLTYEE